MSETQRASLNFMTPSVVPQMLRRQLAMASSPVTCLLLFSLLLHRLTYSCVLVPCNSIPDITLTFGGKAFSISAETFNLGQAEQGSSDCVGGIIGQDVGGKRFSSVSVSSALK